MFKAHKDSKDIVKIVRTSERWCLRQQHHTHALWYYRDRVFKTDTEEKKLLHKVIIFYFLCAQKVFS